MRCLDDGPLVLLMLDLEEVQLFDDDRGGDDGGRRAGATLVVDRLRVAGGDDVFEDADGDRAEFATANRFLSSLSPSKATTWKSSASTSIWWRHVYQ